MITINFNNNENRSSEFDAAKLISEVFKKTVPNDAEGYISVVPNVYLLGQKVKDIDIVVFGQLSNCFIDIDQTKVNVKSFITTVELKSHSLTSVSFRSTNFYVQYNGKHPHNVSKQSDDQKVALANFLSENNFSKTFVTNTIFFNRITASEIESIIPKNIKFKKNIFNIDFNFSDFIKAIIYQNEDNFLSFGNKAIVNNFNIDDQENLNKITYLLESTFVKNFTSIGEYTRRKVESITNSVIMKEITDDSIVRGEPGTGKTHYLLIKALNLSENENKRVILLTYNNVLSNDLKRIFSFTKFHDSYNESGFKIETIHKFIYNFCEILNLLETSKDFIIYYEYYLKTLIEYFESGLINKTEIENNFSDYYFDLIWDCIFVDESQDCSNMELYLFELMVGKNNLFLSLGTNQIVRSIKIEKSKKFIDKPKQLKQLLRQKENILYFNKHFLEQLNIDFSLTNYKRYSGGEIFIIENDFLSSGIYKQLVQNLVKNNCSNYDLMFLVPPSSVNHDKGFINKDEFESQNIPVWDGTINSIRNKISPSNSHRVIQYDSSRGIEAWITCALNFDDFYEYKWNQFNINYYNDQLLTDFEEQRVVYVNNWIKIVLTRSIDTLVITLKNKNSKIANILRYICKNSDIIHYLGSNFYE